MKIKRIALVCAVLLLLVPPLLLVAGYGVFCFHYRNVTIDSTSILVCLTHESSMRERSWSPSDFTFFADRAEVVTEAAEGEAAALLEDPEDTSDILSIHLKKASKWNVYLSILSCFTKRHVRFAEPNYSFKVQWLEQPV